MKNKTFLNAIVIFVFGFIVLTSCGNKNQENPGNLVNAESSEVPEKTETPENQDNPDSSSIFDRWWYDSYNIAADAYFNSNGKYVQHYMYLGNEAVGNGDWAWENEAEKIMKIDNLDGPGQSFITFWLKFVEIQEKNLTAYMSADGKDFNYTIIKYQDTED